MYIIDGYRIKDYKTIGNKYYVAHFETSATDESQTEVFVYATGMAEVGDKQNKMYYTNNIEDFIDCPSNVPSASLAIKINDTSMQPALKKNSYAFIEFNSPLDNKEVQ